ncbi:MAG TPA: DcaP family trimeric outer membrane transporter [Anaeromyxobacteraceae bacterium]|nr:DcaP family trimeric outer membrane transporter [Anaeromyxobacteraceae bacterium]
MARCRATSLGVAAVLALLATAVRAQAPAEAPAAGPPPPAGQPTTPAAGPAPPGTAAPAAKPTRTPARKASPAAAKPAEERRLEEQRQAGESRQRAAAESQALQERIRALEEQIRELEAESARSQGRLERLEDEVPRIGEAAAARDERLAKLEEQASRLPEAADVVKAGDFPGSFRIPGTDAALRIGGQVRVTLVDSFDPIGTDDRFVASSIPIQGTAPPGAGPRVVLTAAPSRFNLDFRTPTGVGTMRAFIEADFAGSSGVLRLRHAFGQWGGFLFGQTWSTFSDPEAEPDGIDFEGLNAISRFRPVQARYTLPLADRLTLAFSLENPQPEVTGATGVNQVPDLILRIRWEPQRTLTGLIRSLGHVQLGLVLRQVRAQPSAPPPDNVHVAGIGLGANGRLHTGWIFENDDLTFGAYWGQGIGRYVSDLDKYFGMTGQGQDAYYDPAAAELRALPILAGYLGYELGWTAALRSTLSAGWVRVWNLDAQPADSLRQTLRLCANLAWSPVPRLDFVAELLAGKRWNKDGEWGRALQLQVGTRFRF